MLYNIMKNNKKQLTNEDSKAIVRWARQAEASKLVAVITRVLQACEDTSRCFGNDYDEGYTDGLTHSKEHIRGVMRLAMEEDSDNSQTTNK